jgi:hypothetical protein
MRGSIGAHLIREAGSGAKEHVAAHGSTSCSLSSPHSCMRGYPVYRVLTRGVMNGDGSHPSLGGHAGRSVVEDSASLGAFYRLEGKRERDLEGMRLIAMVDLQCVGFKVEGEPRAERTEGRGFDGARVSEEEGRGHDSMEGRRVGDVVARLWPL